MLNICLAHTVEEIVEWSVEIPCSLRWQAVARFFRPLVRRALRKILPFHLIAAPSRLGILVGLSAVNDGADEELLSPVLACLNDADNRVRRVAVGLASRLAVRGDATTLAAIGNCLSDDDSAVVQAAKRALLSFAAPGDPNVIAVAETRLQHPEAHVRAAAVEVLGMQGELQDVNAISSLGLLSDPAWEVRAVVVNIFGREADQVDRDTVDSVIARLQDAHHIVRGSAVSALARMAKGNAHAIALIVELVVHADSPFREAAKEALEAVAQRGDPRIIAIASGCLAHEDARVRSCAVELLGCFIDSDDSHSFSLLSSCLEDSAAKVRSAAAAVLSEAQAGPDGRDLLPSLQPYLRHDRAEVRSAALGAIAVETFRHEPGITYAIEEAMRDDAGLVRRAAVVAFRRFFTQDADSLSSVSLASLKACLRDSDALVRASAVEAFGRLASRGDVWAVSQLLPSLRDASGSVRKCAVETLSACVEPVDGLVPQALSGLLADVLPDVRGAAMEALVRLVGPNDVLAVNAVAAQLEASQEGGRRAAMEVLHALVERGSSMAAAALAQHLQRSSGNAQVRFEAGVFAKHFQNALGKPVPNTTRTGRFLSGLKRCLGTLCGHIFPLWLRVQLNWALSRKALAATVEELRAWDPAVRATAMEDLMKLSVPGDSWAVEQVMPGLRDPGARVRRTTAEALRVLAPKGDASAVPLAALLGDVRPDVRNAAAATLAVLVRPHDDSAVEAIAAQLDCNEVDGRSAATQILKELVKLDSRSAAAALTTHKKRLSAIARAPSKFSAFANSRPKRTATGEQ